MWDPGEVLAPALPWRAHYNALLPDNTARQNTATLTLFGIDYPAYADIDFAGVLPTSEVNASLTVNDDYWSKPGSPGPSRPRRVRNL